MTLDPAITEFLAESRECLARIESDLLGMESGAFSPERIAAIFRAVHTIKGACGFLTLPRLETVMHHAEGLLDLLRDGQLVPSREIAVALLSMVDLVRGYLSDIETTGKEGGADCGPVIDVLRRLQEGRAPLPQSVPDDRLPPNPTELPETARKPSTGHDGHDGQHGHDGPDGSVRLDVRLLDGLMDLVGELVLVRNQALRLVSEAGESQFQGFVQQLHFITTELQQRVMKTRMQPIQQAFGTLPRIVRDVAVLCRKSVRVEMEGAGTELDRSLIEAVKGPLTHLVRNAVDHGIELPAVRTARGKRAEGRILLRAFHENGLVNIEVSDDGRGIDWNHVAHRVVQMGMASAEDVAGAKPQDLLRFLFQPGFTTATQVTTVSGRGVGLDVVRSNIEQLGGTVDLRSVTGGGTSVRIKLPLTLAIIPALLVASTGQRYAIPQANVLEIIRIAERRSLDSLFGAPLYRLRGRLLPLIELERELLDEPSAWRAASESAHIVFLRAENQTFGLIVDDVLDTEEIVVKSLPRQVRDVAVFSGATILGDGTVALILDSVGLAQHANILGRELAEQSNLEAETRTAPEEVLSLLLVDLGSGERTAIPIAEVTRLGDIPPEAIERSGEREVVQYRDDILPVIRLARVLGRTEAALEAGAPLPVVIHLSPSGAVALVVKQILDIVEESAPVRRKSVQPGVAFITIVQQRVTEVLDIPTLVGAALRSGKESR